MARALWTRIDRFPKPVIAAINGFAMGGGLELALACHFRLMADAVAGAADARLGLTELNLGIIPGWGGTQRLTQVVGKAKALDLILFSKTLTPAQALSIGLVNRVVAPDRLMDETLAFAEKLALRPPIAVGCVLKAISAGSYEGLDQGLKVEEEGSYIVRDSEDCKEGFAAFIEKRPPVFRGK
jgi:enoyl-CoA hydratase/carnithine racemase